MTVQSTDVFVVSRGGTLHSVTAANANGKIQDTDLLVVRRGTTTYKITGQVFKAAAFQDGDLFIVNRNNTSYKATGAVVKAILKKAPIIQVVTLVEDSSGAPAFTSQAFTATITMQEPGMPVSIRKLKAWVEGDLASQLVSTYTITGITAGSVAPAKGLQYSRRASASANAQNMVYGKIAQDANPTTHDAFHWAAGLHIAGHSDWYIPAKYEMDILCRAFKPTSLLPAHGEQHPANPHSVPPASAGYIQQTNLPQFQAGGSEAFEQFYYWTATENPAKVYEAFSRQFVDGRDTSSTKNIGTYKAKAIRRVPVADYRAAGSPAIGVLFGGGYFAGLISTAGNGVADYALILAPNAGGAYGAAVTSQASLTIAGAQTDGFVVGEGITPPSGALSTGIVALDDTKVDVYSTQGFSVGDKIYGVPKVTPGVRLYLKFDAAGAVSDLQSADPGYVQTTNQANPKLTFPATLPSGKAPDAELPAGTTLTVEVQATNTSGTVTKVSNTLTPAR